jgi:hypothetical protein
MALEQAALQSAPGVIEGIQPLVELVQPVFAKASILVGGIFGIYLLLLIARVHYERKKVKILQDIRYDLDKLNMSKGIKSSRQKKGFFGKIIEKLRKMSRNKKVTKEFYQEKEKPDKTPKKKRKKR